MLIFVVIVGSIQAFHKPNLKLAQSHFTRVSKNVHARLPFQLGIDSILRDDDIWKSKFETNTSKFRKFCSLPFVQIGIVIVFYAFHIKILSSNELNLPGKLFEQLPPTIRSTGYDNIFGWLVLLGYTAHSRFSQDDKPKIRKIDHLPWRKPIQSRLQTFTAIIGIFTLFELTSIYVTPVLQFLLDIVAAFVPMTIFMQRCECLIFEPYLLRLICVFYAGVL